MKSRIKVLENQKAGLLAEASALHQAARDANRSLTAEEKAKDDQLVAGLEAVNDDIMREKRALDFERTAPGAKPSEPEPDAVKPGANPWASGLIEQLRAVRTAGLTGQVDPRLVPSAATGASEGVPSDGGYLVYPEFAAPFIKDAYDNGTLTGKAFKIPMSRNSLEIPTVDETSRANGSRWGGVQVYWAAEGGAGTAKKPKIGSIKLGANRLIGLSYATDDLLEDGPAYEAILQRAFREEFAFVLDNALLRGTGVGQPLGVLNAPCLVTVSKETGQAAATILFENIVKMYARMDARSILGALWYINQDILPQLLTMVMAVGVGGLPVYLPPNGAADRPYGTLLGRPVQPIEQASTLGTVGDVVFADYAQYLLADKGGVKSAVSMHVKFLEEEQTFRWTLRTDGQPAWKSALTPANGSNTVSPFVALETRS